MKEFRIANFKYGLDTRREQLTAQPGTLVTAENCHINPGGEAQKRLAFVENGDVSVLDSNGDQGTFGFENLSGGLTVFGSALPSSKGYTSGLAQALPVVGTGAGAFLTLTVVNGVITAVVVAAFGTGGSGYVLNDYVTPNQPGASGALVKVTGVTSTAITAVTLIRGQQQGQPVLVSAMPAGYVYQQLQHPAVLDALTIDGTYGDASVATVSNGTRGYHGFDGISDTGKADLSTADAVNYDRTKHLMTALVFSNTFNGTSFAAATFADGNTFLYYNSIVVRQSCTGKVLNSYTTDRNRPISISYSAMVELNALNGWAAQVNPSATAIPETDPTLTSRNYYAPCRIGVTGDSANAILAIVPTRTTSLAVTQAIFDAFAKPNSTLIATAGQTASFLVTKASGTPIYRVSISLPLAGETAFTQFDYRVMADVTWATSDINTAGLIATAITALQPATGYSATNSGTATVTIIAPLPTTPPVGTTSPNNALVAIVSGGTDSSAPGTHAFTTGAYQIGFGQLAKITVDGASSPVWATGDTWSVAINHFTQGNITIGLGNIAFQPLVSAIKLGQREYITLGSSFACSAVGDPTGWEEQNIGASVVEFVSQFGGQDSVQAFSHMQGRLAVFGKQSIQMWTVDADPNNFALIQTMDNIGTIAPFSVQSIGDVDSYFLDSSGFRSLKPKEVTLNAYPDDVGIAIDLTIRMALVGYDATLARSIIEPLTRQYWCYLNGSIYVLSNYPTSKVLAWSVYKPTYDVAMVFQPFSDHYDGSGNSTYASLVSGNTYVWTKGVNDTSLTVNGVTYTATVTFVYDGVSTATIIGTASQLVTASLVQHVQTSFVPTKFVVFNKQVYVRADNNKVYLYGGTDGNTYDRCLPTVELPFLAIGDGSMRLKGMGVDATIKGNWDIYASMNPRGTPTKVIENKGSGTSPDSLQDSTYDTGHYTYASTGTHFKLKAIGGPYPINMKLSSLTFLYDSAGIK